jgi:hypothetical protein
MTSIHSQVIAAHPAFHKGEQVVLAAGTYQGTRGVFQHLREDMKWAEIAERNGSVRSYPVAWLALAVDATRRPAN